MPHRHLSLLLWAMFGAMLLGPSQRVETTDASTPAEAVQAPTVEITMHRGRVLLRTAPWTDFEIWRVDEFNRIVGRWEGMTSSSGTKLISLVLDDTGGREVIDPLEAGQRLFVDLDGGDPLVFLLPEIAVRADPVDDLLSGEAPPGSRLSVSVSERKDLRWESDEIVVGPSGRWSVSTAGEHDLVEVSHGRVTLLRDDGNRIGVDWVVPLVEVDLDASHLLLTGPLHRSFDWRLIGADGQERARLAGRSHPGSVNDFAMMEAWPLTDVQGNPIYPQPGDRVAGFFGDDEIDLEIPRLEFVLDWTTGFVRGSSSAVAGTPLRLQLSSQEPNHQQWDLVLDEAGSFEVDLSASTPPWMLQPNNHATLELRPPGASVKRRTAIPGLFLYLDGPRVLVLLAPRERATISHQRGTGTLASLELRANDHGSVRLALAEGEQPWDLREGDVLRLEVDRLLGPLVTTLPIPKMSLRLDLEANEMQGCAILPAGSRYRLRTEPHGLPWDEILSWLGGCFELRFDEHPLSHPPGGEAQPLQLAPGHAATATVWLASGHLIFLHSRVPLFHVQPESAEVCVRGNPWAEIILEGDPAAGSPVQARARTDAYGRARLSLRDAAGDPQAVARGHHLKGAMEGTSYDITVPPFRVEADWLFFDLVLHGIPGKKTSVTFPGRYTDCMGSDSSEVALQDWGWHSDVTVYGGGQAVHNLVDLVEGHGADLRRGLVLDHPTLEGHRTYLRLYPLHLEAHLGTNRVVGWGAQGETVDLTVYDAGDDELGAGSATIEPSGSFALRMEAVDDAEPAPIYLQSGHRLEAGTPTDQSGFVLPPLDFDWSEDAGLDGDTLPGASVSLTFMLADGQERTMSRTADADGSFTFRPAEIPAADPWTTADVTGLRAVIEVDAWHTAVRSWPRDPDAPAPTAGPPVPTATQTLVPSETPVAPSATATPDAPAPTATATRPNRPPIVLRKVVWLPWAKR